MLKRLAKSLAIAVFGAGIVSTGEAVQAAPVTFGSNAYDFVLIQNPFDGRDTWTESKNAAASLVYNGIQGHLATVTSQAENTFLLGIAPAGLPGFQGAWLGGWATGWLAGPENGQTFAAVGGYQNWNAVEPNNAGFMYMSIGSSTPNGGVAGNWLDDSGVQGAANNLDPVIGYFVEFEGAAQAVPAPASLALVLFGLAALYRRRAKAFSTVAAALAFAAPAAQAAVITYADFSSTSGLTLVGNAAQSGNVLRVTPAAGSQAGAAYSTSPITLGASATFSTTFQFRLSNPGGIHAADGITFVLAANPTGLGGTGVGMGYSGVPNSVAIEFDTYNNAGFGLGNNDGNSSNHVAVDVNGSLTNSALHNVYGIQTCDAPYGPGCMSNGNVWTATIGYDGATKLLSVAVKDAAMAVADVAINSYFIDIAAALGTNTAFVGFTAATGAGWENQDILNWQFADSTILAPSVPLPASTALLAVGLVALGWRRRRIV